MLHLAFYCCFYGSDQNKAFQIPKLPSQKYPCFFFTNNTLLLKQLQFTGWRPVSQTHIHTEDDLIESAMVSKHVKAMPHGYPELQFFDYTVYMDTKVPWVNETMVEEMIQTYFVHQSYALLLRTHWFLNTNIWNDFILSVERFERYRLQEDQMKQYIASQVSQGLTVMNDELFATGFLIRNMKHEKIHEINETWYQHIQQCGIQCQISFFFVRQLFSPWIHSFKEYPYLEPEM